MEWYWLSLGAVVCVFGGALFGTVIFKRRSSNYIRKFELDEVKEELCEDDGATIVKRLMDTTWNLEITEFLDMLDFKHVSEAQLRMFVSEQWIIIKKNTFSLEVACKRFKCGKDAIALFSKLVDKNKESLEHLESFASEVLKIDLKDYMVCAEAQTYPHCLSFMTNHGSCAELLCALFVNIPVRNLAFERLRNGLMKDRGWCREQVVYLEHMGSPIPDFAKVVLRALDEQLRLDRTSWKKIESNAKLLQESEKLFWESTMNQIGEPDPFDLPRESYWEGMNLPARPELSGILANTPFELGRQSAIIGKRKTVAQVDSQTKRTFSEPVINVSGSHFLKRKVSNWSDVQMDTEIQEIAKHMESLSTNFNAAQDVGEDISQEVGEDISQSHSVNFLQKMPTEESEMEKKKCSKLNDYVVID